MNDQMSLVGLSAECGEKWCVLGKAKWCRYSPCTESHEIDCCIQCWGSCSSKCEIARRESVRKKFPDY